MRGVVQIEAVVIERAKIRSQSVDTICLYIALLCIGNIVTVQIQAINRFIRIIETR